MIDINDTRLIKLYEDAEKELIEEIKKHDLNKNQGRLALISQVQKILQELYKPTISYLDDGVQSQQQEALEELQSIKPNTNFNLIDKKASEMIFAYFDGVSSIAKQDIKLALGNAYFSFQNLLNQSSKETKTLLLDEIAKGQILGKGRDKITQILIDKIENKQLKGYNQFELKSYITTITQSAMIQSRAGAVVDRALSLGQDLLQVSSHTRNLSPMCKPHQGKIISITGQTAGYPTLASILWNGTYRDGSGIFHPRCKHSLTIYIP